MMPLRLLAGFLLLLSLPLPAGAAADLGIPECADPTLAALSKDQRIYRAVVYGSKKAADLPVNAMLYDKEGKAWVKKAKNSWTPLPSAGSASSSSAGATQGASQQSDDSMDKAKENPTREGILERKRTATSDLIPDLTQSLRALQCRLRATCAASEKSQIAKPSDSTVKVQPYGCVEFELPVFRGCDVSPGISVAFVTPNSCINAADALFAQERNLLNLSIAYDASYRTIAQFSGMFEGFLSEFRFPLLNPLWQTVRVLGGLKNIPCFLSQCEE